MAGDADEQLQAIVTGAIQLVAVQDRAAAAGIDPDELLALVAPVPGRERRDRPGRRAQPRRRGGGDHHDRSCCSSPIITYGNLVLTGVVEEKSSRVVEVLLARMPARNLLAGKVAGIGLLGLAQFAVTALAALVATIVVDSVDLPAVRGSVLAWVVVWFVLGYALYATAYGALGVAGVTHRGRIECRRTGQLRARWPATGSRTWSSARTPTAGGRQLVSLFPATAPFAMSGRIALGAAAWWEPRIRRKATPRQSRTSRGPATARRLGTLASTGPRRERRTVESTDEQGGANVIGETPASSVAVQDRPPAGPGAVKREVVVELGQTALLLPTLVSRGLEANDRAKYLLSLLQAARTHADEPTAPFSPLREERLAAGIGDDELDRIVSRSCRVDDGLYLIPGARALHDALIESVAEMLEPLVTSASADRLGADRFDALVKAAPDLSGDRVPGDYIDAIASGDRARGDSLHVLVMDTHRALNRLQAEVATETLDGASVYLLDDADRPLVSAFMAGIHTTGPLKFEHPGLGTTATRVGGRLLIQNDIGQTAAHVVVLTVEGLVATVTYTDVHVQRLRFFKSLIDRFPVDWSDAEHRGGAALGEHHLVVGRYVAPDPARLEAYLRHVGSRLVFLIDWNKARKRLVPIVGKKDAIGLLAWAAEADYGHMAFLLLGGERLVYDAVELAAKVPARYGEPLRDVIGEEATLEVLRFALRTASEGLRSGKSHRLIRDELPRRTAAPRPGGAHGPPFLGGGARQPRRRGGAGGPRRAAPPRHRRWRRLRPAGGAPSGRLGAPGGQDPLGRADRRRTGGRRPRTRGAPGHQRRRHRRPRRGGVPAHDASHRGDCRRSTGAGGVGRDRGRGRAGASQDAADRRRARLRRGLRRSRGLPRGRGPGVDVGTRRRSSRSTGEGCSGDGHPRLP